MQKTLRRRATWKLWMAWSALVASTACAGGSPPVSAPSLAVPSVAVPAGCGTLCLEVVPNKIHFDSPKSGARTIKVRNWNGKIYRTYGCKSKRIVTIQVIHLHFYGWSYLKVKPIGRIGECLYPFYGHYEGRVFFHAVVGK